MEVNVGPGSGFSVTLSFLHFPGLTNSSLAKLVNFVVGTFPKIVEQTILFEGAS